MESSALELVATIALIAISLRLGWVVHRRSISQRPVHGGATSALFNYLSASCFAAILPTVLTSVFILRPENVTVAGIVWHPLILAVLTLGVRQLSTGALARSRRARPAGADYGR